MMHRPLIVSLFLLLAACGGGPSLEGTYLGDPAPVREALSGSAAQVAAETSGEIVDVSLVVERDNAYLVVRAAEGENLGSFTAVRDGTILSLDTGTGPPLRFVLQESGDLACGGCSALGLPATWLRQR